MLAAHGYKTKKELKDSKGKSLRYNETSFFGDEFKANGKNYVVGPSATIRKWYAAVTTENGLIVKVE